MPIRDRGSREGRGRIVNVASMYGIVAPSSHLSHTAYTTAKHGKKSRLNLPSFYD